MTDHERHERERARRRFNEMGAHAVRGMLVFAALPMHWDSFALSWLAEQPEESRYRPAPRPTRQAGRRA
jgi:hypothetical protein